MSWKPMNTVPKDGTVIVVYAEYQYHEKVEKLPSVFPAFYCERKGKWDSYDWVLCSDRSKSPTTSIVWVDRRSKR